jgi:ABC-2 type transport system permease protein
MREMQRPELSPFSRGAVRNVYLIARREFLTRARSRFFLIGTVVLMILLAGYIVLQSQLNGRPTTVKVGFIGDAQVLAAPLRAVAPASLKVRARTSDLSAGRARW